MKSKDRVLDLLLRIRDLLREVIPTLTLEVKDMNKSYGDGGFVLAIKSEGIQEYISESFRACANSPFKKNSQPMSLSSLNSLSKRRFSSKSTSFPEITSKPLSDINIFTKALNEIKSNKGTSIPRIDGQTLEGISKKKLEQLQKDILS